MTHDPSQQEQPVGMEADSLSDREWLRAVFERYQRPLIAYVSRLLGGDFETARDCVQDVFVQLCRERRDHVERYAEAWLFKCCRHRAMDRYRKESRMVVQYATDQIENCIQGNSTLGESIHLAEEKARLQQEIAALPSREQEVLALRLQQGLSYKQIAQVLDLSVSHVGVLLHQAVVRLRNTVSAS